MSGAKIIEGLKEAIRGDLTRVWIDGKCWTCEPRQQWRSDMENAPRDGTPVRVADPSLPYTAKLNTVAYWAGAYWRQLEKGKGGRILHPSHWQPVEPPEPGQ